MTGGITRKSRRVSVGFADLVALAFANTNKLLLRLDSLAGEARSLTIENRSDLRETVTNLTEAARQLNHFVEQMSRRPLRALTGVTPLARDSVRRDTARGSGGSEPREISSCTH